MTKTTNPPSKYGPSRYIDIFDLFVIQFVYYQKGCNLLQISMATISHKETRFK